MKGLIQLPPKFSLSWRQGAPVKNQCPPSYFIGTNSIQEQSEQKKKRLAHRNSCCQILDYCGTLTVNGCAILSSYLFIKKKMFIFLFCPSLTWSLYSCLLPVRRLDYVSFVDFKIFLSMSLGLVSFAAVFWMSRNAPPLCYGLPLLH